MDSRENTQTVKAFLTAHVGEDFSMMTPGGFVELTAEQTERLLDGQGAVAHPGVAGITMTLFADELLEQIIDSANWKDGVWYLMTHTPAMERREQEADRQFAVFHVTENGGSEYVLAEENLELLLAACRLRSYIRKSPNEAPHHFTEMLPRKEQLSREQFDTYVSERLANTGRVVGAFRIDLDNGRFDALNIMDGWKRFRIRDVTNAVYFAMQKSNVSPEEQWGSFLDHLQGKEVVYETELQFLTGSRSLRAEDISFAEDIIQNDNLLEFYMEVAFDADQVFGINVCTTENDDWLDIYANYDLERGCVCDTLEVFLQRGNGDELDFQYRLSPEEQALFIPKMNAYCQEHWGQSLEECSAAYLAEQRQASPEMQM